MSLWWSDGHNSDLFWRTSQSGGRATTRWKKGKGTRGHVGDICATDETGAQLLGYVTFELKRGYNRHSLHDLIDKPNRAAEQEMEKWITQAKQAKKLSKSRHWLVVSRRDRREPLLIAPTGLLTVLGVPVKAVIRYIGKKGFPREVEVGLLQSLWDADPKPVRDMLAG